MPDKGKLARRLALLALAGIWGGCAWWQGHKPLPAGLHVAGPAQTAPLESVKFLTDLTANNNYGEPVIAQQIQAATLDLIRNARGFLVLDYFLFNEQGGPAGPLRYRAGIQPVARELREALLTLHAERPTLPILVLIDPINDYYRGSVPAEFAPLTQAGINVVVSDLDRLRDSNPAYSTTWRLLLGWWLKPGIDGGFSNPLNATGPKLSLGALTQMPHFKANHRKVIITGTEAGSLVGIVGSANPHDASSAHSNVALRIEGEALRPLLDSELTIAQFSGWKGWPAGTIPRVIKTTANVSDNTAQISVATEGAIREALLVAINQCLPEDSIDIAQFYLSDRDVINTLITAADRGVTIRVLLDPNKDAFGFEKSGLPNREVAGELVAASGGAIKLRWYRTHGEQFHSKMAAIRSDGHLWLTTGSANFTRRNLGDYNLEANAIVRVPLGSALDQQVGSWFEMLWNNRPGGIEYTADTDVYAEASQGRYWLYRFMEGTGLSTF